MGRSDSERAPVLSAMPSSVSAWRSTAGCRCSNVADLTSPTGYAVSPRHAATAASGVGGPVPCEVGLVLGPLVLERAEALTEELEELEGELQPASGRGAETTESR